MSEVDSEFSRKMLSLKSASKILEITKECVGYRNKSIAFKSLAKVVQEDPSELDVLKNNIVYEKIINNVFDNFSASEELEFLNISFWLKVNYSHSVKPLSEKQLKKLCNAANGIKRFNIAVPFMLDIARSGIYTPELLDTINNGLSIYDKLQIFNIPGIFKILIANPMYFNEKTVKLTENYIVDIVLKRNPLVVEVVKIIVAYDNFCKFYFKKINNDLMTKLVGYVKSKLKDANKLEIIMMLINSIKSDSLDKSLYSLISEQFTKNITKNADFPINLHVEMYSKFNTLSKIDPKLSEHIEKSLLSRLKSGLVTLDPTSVTQIAYIQCLTQTNQKDFILNHYNFTPDPYKYPKAWPYWVGIFDCVEKKFNNQDFLDVSFI